MKYFGIIYKATNIINGKVYIGQTIHKLNERISNHMSKNSGCVYFKNALNKYDSKNFTWVILCKCSNENELNEKEKYYIEYYKSYNKKHGYNLNRGGSGNVGFKHSKKTKNKISKSKIGVSLPSLSEEHKNKISMANKGNYHTEESKLKMSKARFGKYRGQDSWKSKKYVVELPNGEKYIIKGLRNFCRELDESEQIVSYKGLNAVAVGKRNHHKGFKCRYFDEEKDKDLKIWQSEKTEDKS